MSEVILNLIIGLLVAYIAFLALWQEHDDGPPGGGVV